MALQNGIMIPFAPRIQTKIGRRVPHVSPLKPGICEQRINRFSGRQYF
jgi:hypothetical protein